MRQRRVYGWSQCCEPRNASIGQLARQMTYDFPPMRYFMGPARRCRCCHFSSRPITECLDSTRVIPVPACVIFLTSATITGTIVTNCWTRRQERLYFRVTWYHPKARLIPPANAVGNPPTTPPGDIYVPMPAPVPSVAAPAPAPAPTPAPPTPPPPIPMSNFPAQIPPRASHKLAHERYIEMPGRTCGETRVMHGASREYARRHGMPLDHAALASMLDRVKRYTRSYTNTTRRLSGPADRARIRSERI